MPSLQPENFVALRVTKLWEHECFGIPLEILEQINGDFDGDECNLYFLRNPVSQAECEILLNSKENAAGSTLDFKLNPSQGMKVVYHRLYTSSSPKLNFLPHKHSSLKKTFKMIYDLEGSEKMFECIDQMRKLYLDEMQNQFVFGLSVTEMIELSNIARECENNFERFCDRVKSVSNPGCLLTQVFSGAKGELFHLFLMYGSIGFSGESSFWDGLKPHEAERHAIDCYCGLKKSSEIWGPGYDFYKYVFCLQGVHVDYRARLVDGFRGLVI